MFRKRKYECFLGETGYASFNLNPNKFFVNFFLSDSIFCSYSSGQNGYGSSTFSQNAAGHNRGRSCSCQNDTRRSNPSPGEPGDGNSRQEALACFNCGAPDHIARVCGKARKKDYFVTKNL